MSTRILLADDHVMVRQGLRSLIEKEHDMEVVGEVDNGRAALELVAELVPDVIIMDISMPNLNGINATSRIVQEFPGIKVIALSMHSSERFVTGMLNAGASGYILKDCLFDELAKAIRTVISGNIYLSSQITGVVVGEYVRHVSRTTGSQLKLLSDREHEVLQLISEGMSIKQIAFKLHLSSKTVEANRRQIMVKLDIHSVAELTKFAVREGLTSL